MRDTFGIGLKHAAAKNGNIALIIPLGNNTPYAYNVHVYWCKNK